MKNITSSTDIWALGVQKRPKYFANSWENLAKLISELIEISITPRALQNWRNDLRYKSHWPRPKSGRHDARKWIAFILRFGLKRADEVVDPSEIPEERRTIRDWKDHREKLLCTQLERAILRDDRILLVATEIEIAIGQLIAGVSVALDHFAPSAARFVVGLRDIHDVQAKLQSEIDAVKQRINAAHYLDECEEAAKPYLQRIGRLLLADIRGIRSQKAVTATRKRGTKAAGKD